MLSFPLYCCEITLKFLHLLFQSILVPFAVESSLSGVQKELGKEKELWYKRTFNIYANARR